MMRNVYYWSPCLEKVGTYWSTMNSAIALAKYNKNRFSVKMINVCGEWDTEKSFLEENNIELIDLGLNYFKFLPKTGFFKSRFSFLVIFMLSIFPLIKLLKTKPDYLIIHLITSLPIILFSILNFNTKLILRISGLPKINLFRGFLWRMASKKIHKILSPSNDLISQLSKIEIFPQNKLFFLPDPIIRIRKFIDDIKSSNEKNLNNSKRKYFISVGRLTKQKNFTYLIDEFYKFTKNNDDYDLFIFGEGEYKKKLLNQINNYNLSNRIFLKGYSKNIYSHMKGAQAFILSSLWEDPGFVIIEAGMCNLFIISSNCKNGPREFLQNGKGGLLFESNKKKALEDSLNSFINLNKNLVSYKIATKKNCMKYTLFRHFKIFEKILLIS